MGDDKTEKATPKKRRDERKKGNVVLSNDVVGVATLFGGIAMLRIFFAGSALAVGEFLVYCLSLAQKGGGLSMGLLLQAIALLVRTAGPLLLAGILLSITATFAQTQLLVSAELIKPKLEKISPRLFSLRSLVEALKGLLKVSILLYLIYTSLRDMINVAVRYLYADLNGAARDLFAAIFVMLLKVTFAFLVIAAIDYLYQWWDYERQMRMSKQEIKEEYKQTEGDPQVKGRIKELQRRMAQSRMMQQVPQADVIVRNPTHVAVALRYHPSEDAAPIVLAKGLDSLAERIIAVAEEHDIVILEDVPLARALYQEAELYKAIPADLYEAVAEVMVYLYKLGRVKA